MKTIYFVTKSNYKFERFTASMELPELIFQKLEHDTPEVQSMENKEIAEYSASWAANKFRLPVIKEDVGLFIDALGGFPGPYLSRVERLIKSDGFLKLMHGKANRKARWKYVVAFCEPNQSPVSFSTTQEGTIALEAKGSAGYESDRIFIPSDFNRTVAELLNSKQFIRSSEHYRMLERYLRSNTKFNTEHSQSSL